MKKYNILFVCLGNICRSPAADGIMKKMIHEKNLQDYIEVDSAGTSGYHDGELPDARMRRHGARRNYIFDSLSRKFVLNDFDKFDIILTMDDSNYNNVVNMSPDLESKNKVFRMTDFSTDTNQDHIPDPYYMGHEGFEFVLDLLEDSCKNLLRYIESTKVKKH